MRILVTAIGSMAADIVIKTMHKCGHQVIGTDIYPREWIADAGNVDHFIQAPPARDKIRYLEFIDEICNSCRIDAIIPLTDPEVELISHSKEKLLGRGVMACVMDSAQVSLCRDKYRLPRFLAEHGWCHTIPTFLIGPAHLPLLPLPWHAKPRFGRSSQGLIQIGHEHQKGYLHALAGSIEYVVQPLIEGDVCTVDVVRDVCDRVVCVARRELLRNPSGAGLTVEIIDEPTLTGICERIARGLNTIGAVNFEFIENSGRFYLLEINPRLSGGVEFSHLAGYGVVENHLRCFQNMDIQPISTLAKMIIARKYEEHITTPIT